MSNIEVVLGTDEGAERGDEEDMNEEEVPEVDERGTIAGVGVEFGTTGKLSLSVL